MKPRAPLLVVIGCSTGGPDALERILPELPADLPVPIAIVQHMPPMFTRLLAARLDGQCRFRVHEAAQGMLLEPGQAYVAPGDWHMTLGRGARGLLQAQLHQGPQENFCRPAVDVLLRSATHELGSATLAVVLTGMGHDGLAGARELHAAGGRILVQDEATSVVWGMPGIVAQDGLAEAVLPLERIAGEILARVSLPTRSTRRR